MNRRVVIDTNCWISAFFSPDGKPAQAVQLALDRNIVAHSAETLAELVEVLSRPKFDRLLPLEDRLSFFGSVAAAGVVIAPAHRFTECRDPKDDKFLDLAYAAGADCIISGDEHLREMKHFRGVQIWSPAQFLERELAHFRARDFEPQSPENDKFSASRKGRLPRNRSP